MNVAKVNFKLFKRLLKIWNKWNWHIRPGGNLHSLSLGGFFSILHLFSFSLSLHITVLFSVAQGFKSQLFQIERNDLSLIMRFVL
jgi:hypothetical protein